MTQVHEQAARQRTAPLGPRVERVAALYDIHGNLPALDATLDAVARANVDCIIIGGDVALGPMPAQVLDRLESQPIPVHFLRGNCDRLVTDASRGVLPEKLPSVVRKMVEWVAAQLSPRQLDLLARLPMTLRMDIAAQGPVRFCHATLRSDDEIVTPFTHDAQLPEMFPGVEEVRVVCGHTHVQFARRFADWELVNAGSVGMSTGAAEAHWLLLDNEATLQRTPYDASRASEAIAATSYPDAQGFIAGYIASAPTVETTWSRLNRA